MLPYCVGMVCRVCMREMRRKCIRRLATARWICEWHQMRNTMKQPKMVPSPLARLTRHLQSSGVASSGVGAHGVHVSCTRIKQYNRDVDDVMQTRPYTFGAINTQNVTYHNNRYDFLGNNR